MIEYVLDQAGLGVAHMRIADAPRVLRPFVAGSVIVKHPASVRAKVNSWRIVPDGSPHLILHRIGARDGSSRRWRVRLVGARTVYTDASIRHRETTVGVQLHPGVLPLLTADRADALTDRGAPVPCLFGAAGAQLVRRLEESPGPEDALRHLLDFLAARLAAGPSIHWLVRGFAAASQTSEGEWRTVAGVARRLGVAERTLRGVFRAHVGLSPKRFLQIARVHRALGAGLAVPDPGWVAVAHAAGYCDQAHMIKEFASLLGETPVRYLARRESAADS